MAVASPGASVSSLLACTIVYPQRDQARLVRRVQANAALPQAAQEPGYPSRRFVTRHGRLGWRCLRYRFDVTYTPLHSAMRIDAQRQRTLMVCFDDICQA